MRYNKYGNQKVVYEGIKFDSKKELRRYLELRLLLRSGAISKLELQKPYILIDKSDNGRQIVYKADFVYVDNRTNTTVVEDVKGVRTDVYKLKKRLMAERYGIIITEI